MEETLKSLADLPQLVREQAQAQEQNNPEQNNHERPVSKYAAKQQRRRALTEQGPRDQQDRQQRHEVRRSAALADTEKWMAVVRIATSLDQLSAKVELIENRLNALVLPEPGSDLETLAETTGEALKASTNTVVNLVRVALEEQAQDLRKRQKEIQTQITNDVTGVHERINARLSDLITDVCDTRDLLRELLRRIGDPADTPISSRLREVQYIVKRLENPPDDPKEDPQDRTHWLPRWACQLLFGSEEVHVTDHGVWTEVHIGDKTDYGATSLWDLYKKIRSARRSYKVQQKIAALQAQLQSNTPR